MPKPLPRRAFLITLAAAGTGLATRVHARVMVEEKDPQAISLGYVADAKRVNAKKYPKYVAGQVCTNCVLFKGKAADKVGGCPLFGAKQVAGRGWCNAWAKKP